MWEKSVRSIGIGICEELIHLQIVYFKANAFRLYISGKRMRAKALKYFVVG